MNTFAQDRFLPRHDCRLAAGGMRARAGRVVLLSFLLWTIPASAEVDAATYVPATDPVAEYLGAIERAEAQNSAYSMELADLYLGLGQSLLEREEFDDAKAAFQQGMQIERVNLGLNSTGQTNYLFSIADVEIRRGDWRSADLVLQDVYTINSRAYGEDHPDLLPVLGELMNWYLQSRSIRPPEVAYWNLTRSESLASRMAAILEQDKGLTDPGTAAVYRKIGRLHYFMAEQLVRHEISAPPGAAYSAYGRVTNQTAQGVSVVKHYIGGRNAFSRVVESISLQEDSTPQDHAEAIAQLGDWYLIFGKTQTAGKTYRQAWDTLALGAQSTALAESVFGRPTPLRFLRDEPNDGAPDQGAKTVATVEISMTVTRTGRLEDIEVIDPPDGLKPALIQQTKRKMREMRFRPRLSDGVPQRTENFVWRYRIRQA